MERVGVGLEVFSWEIDAVAGEGVEIVVVVFRWTAWEVVEDVLFMVVTIGGV